MFKVNDVVVYGSQGVCEIIGIDERKIDGVSRTYFVLKPKDDRGTTCYIPTWNEKALSNFNTFYFWRYKNRGHIFALYFYTFLFMKPFVDFRNITLTKLSAFFCLCKNSLVNIVMASKCTVQ